VTGYRFKIGQSVHFRAAARLRAPSGIYRIIQRLPAEKDQLRYLIRSLDEEEYEQIANESDLGKI